MKLILNYRRSLLLIYSLRKYEQRSLSVSLQLNIVESFKTEIYFVASLYHLGKQFELERYTYDEFWAQSKHLIIQRRIIKDAKSISPWIIISH